MTCEHRFTERDFDYAAPHWIDMQERMRACSACGTCVQLCSYCGRAYALRGCPYNCDHDAEDAANWCAICDRCAACCQEAPGPLTAPDIERVLRFIATHVANRHIERGVFAAVSDADAADVITGWYGRSGGALHIECRGKRIEARVSHRTGKLSALDAAKLIRRRVRSTYHCITCSRTIVTSFEPDHCDDYTCPGGIVIDAAPAGRLDAAVRVDAVAPSEERSDRPQLRLFA